MVSEWLGVALEYAKDFRKIYIFGTFKKIYDLNFQQPKLATQAKIWDPILIVIFLLLQF